MTANRPVSFGILGAGMIAEYHRRAIEANAAFGARLAAVGHHDPARFAAVGAAFGVPCVGADELLAHPAVDVVCICTPSGQHPAQAIAAARHGKHVLVEKPMATRVADARAMIAACDDAGVRLGVVLQRRTDDLFRRIRDAVAAGDLGDLTLGVVTMPYHRPAAYYAQADWRGTWAGDGGGVLMNQGIHLVDLLVWFMGDPVRTHAFAATLQRAIEVEDTLAATLEFGDGALATIAATTTALGSPHRLELYGTHGTIQVEGEQAHVWQLPTRSPLGWSRRPWAGPRTPARRATRAASVRRGHIQIVRDFVAACATAGRRPSTAPRGCAAWRRSRRSTGRPGGSPSPRDRPARRARQRGRPWPATDATA
jgi:UDP-N-acetyl-2-amino-2-deoxyglucuronate dehydrogenase